jgi:hypothetical protein
MLYLNRDAPDTVFAGYPAGRISGRPDILLIQKPDTVYPVRAGYRISGRIFVATNAYIFGKIQNKFYLKSFKNYSLQQT